MIAAAPLLHQTENHIIDADYYWTKKGKLPWAELKHLIDKPASLWSNGDSTYLGLNDRVRWSSLQNEQLAVSHRAGETQCICSVRGCSVRQPEAGRVRANFAHQGLKYILIVTDPVAERAFFAKPDGRYPLTTTYLCVSLGEAHTDGNCYKLVAAVITKQPL